MEVRQRTLERQQEKEARLDAFLETTRARIGKEKEPCARVVVVKAKGVAGANDEHLAMPAGETALACPAHVRKACPDSVGACSAAIDEKTRRRLDQSLSLLLPRASGGSIARSKRVRAWDGQPSRGEGGIGGGSEEDSLLPASDIAADLGDAVYLQAATEVLGEWDLLAVLAAHSQALARLLTRERARCCAASPTDSVRESRYSPIAAST